MRTHAHTRTHARRPSAPSVYLYSRSLEACRSLAGCALSPPKLNKLNDNLQQRPKQVSGPQAPGLESFGPDGLPVCRSRQTTQMRSGATAVIATRELARHAETSEMGRKRSGAPLTLKGVGTGRPPTGSYGRWIKIPQGGPPGGIHRHRRHHCPRQVAQRAWRS